LVETHRAGRIRILATSGQERYLALPDVPTFLESGFDIRGSGWFGMYAPAKTPYSVIERLNATVVAAVRAPAVRDRLLQSGLKPTGTTPAEFARIQTADNYGARSSRHPVSSQSSSGLTAWCRRLGGVHHLAAPQKGLDVCS
jgi:tripartite-type tricarboxylate transporter receptor subunit TctC